VDAVLSRALAAEIERLSERARAVGLDPEEIASDEPRRRVSYGEVPAHGIGYGAIAVD
jgi:hypothetical protein